MMNLITMTTVETQTDSSTKETLRTTELKVQDVICSSKRSLLSGRIPFSQRHPGNARLRVLAQINAVSYHDADRGTKIQIARRLVDIVKEYGGRFLLFKDDVWCVAEELRATKEGKIASSHAILHFFCCNKSNLRYFL
jgi:hypothetical protein